MEADRLGLCEALDTRRLIIIADTNFFMFIAQGIVTPSMIMDAVLRGYIIVVCPQIRKELELLAEKAPKASTRRTARRALSILSRLSACEISCPGEKADDAIVLAALSLARQGYMIMVATSDKELRRRVRSHGVPTLYYRESERRLEPDWEPL